jgi:cysteinyl-tRNA synthetase
VTFIRNVTHIDDKVVNRAARTGEPWWAIAARVELDFRDAYRALKCRPPTAEPRATGHIPDMIVLTERLISAGAAYAESGKVYFSIDSAADYGALSGQVLHRLRTTADGSALRLRPAPPPEPRTATLGEPAGWSPGDRPDSAWVEQFTEALDDDLNVSRALAALHGAVKASNVALREDDDHQVDEPLTELGIELADTPTRTTWRRP